MDALFIIVLVLAVCALIGLYIVRDKSKKKDDSE